MPYGNRPRGSGNAFRDAATLYHDLGMSPLPAQGKHIKVKGKTGRDRTNVTLDDIGKWRAAPWLENATNIAVVLPSLYFRCPVECLIAFDLDDPGQHKAQGDGVRLLHELERELGPLPPTWSNGHGDTPYRHLLYRVKLDNYKSLGPGIDLITPWNRYLIVWPSIHPGTGEIYEWRDPDGDKCGPPRKEDIPRLPKAWEDFLREPRPETRRTSVDPKAWDGKPGGGGQPCPAMRHVADKWSKDPYLGASSRHDGWLSLCMQLLGLQAMGHTGTLSVLDKLYPVFADLTAYRRKDPSDAAREAKSIYDWALKHVTPPEGPVQDPCTAPGPFKPLVLKGERPDARPLVLKGERPDARPLVLKGERPDARPLVLKGERPDAQPLELHPGKAKPDQPTASTPLR